MTLEDFKELTSTRDHWAFIWPTLRRVLIERTLSINRVSRCVIESAQAETARAKELSSLIAELDKVGVEPAEPKPLPRMKPLNSMSEAETE